MTFRCELSGDALDMAISRACGMDSTDPTYQPSSNWQQGGPIIEHEQIYLAWNGKRWEAGALCDYGNEGPWCEVYEYGETPLVAAMRAFVAAAPLKQACGVLHKILAEEAGVPVGDVTGHLEFGLGIQPTRWADIQKKVSEALGIKIRPEQADWIRTVGNYEVVIKHALEAKTT